MSKVQIDLTNEELTMLLAKAEHGGVQLEEYIRHAALVYENKPVEEVQEQQQVLEDPIESGEGTFKPVKGEDAPWTPAERGGSSSQFNAHQVKKEPPKGAPLYNKRIKNKWL